MNITEALNQLGVRDDILTPQEKANLDRDGFLRLERVLTLDHVGRINRRMDELLAEEGAEAGKEVHQEAGTNRLADLVNKGEVFHPMFVQPRVLAAVNHVLGGDLKLSTLNSRDALPGFGQQGFHMDWNQSKDPVPDKYDGCNTMWLLTDFTLENGVTRIIPGSHRICRYPDKVLADPVAPHPEEVHLVGKAGDVMIFNCQCWHSGTLNRSDKPRRGITAFYTRRHIPQMTDQRKHLRPETQAALDDAALVMLDVG